MVFVKHIMQENGVKRFYFLCSTVGRIRAHLRNLRLVGSGSAGPG